MKFSKDNLDDIKWLAGFFDGEGTINLSEKGYVNAHLRVSIGQKNESLIRHLKSEFGGVVGEIKTSGVFLVSFTNKADIENFLNQVLPYLKLKRKEAIVALAICSLIPPQGVPASEEDKNTRLYLEYQLREAASQRPLEEVVQ